MALNDFESALNETNEIDLTTTGRVTGRETSRPVWFVRQDDKLYLLPVTGSRSQWYKNLLVTPTIGLYAGDAAYSTRGNPITNPDKVSQVIDDFRAKYGADDVAEYYSDPDVAVEVPLG
ncbi:nitroreductase family deazaflavin-dependent oxidoreductase [Nonomuraea sp. K274]|uniref:Nitroreductase family deazaflavin-dependent oxidoreductase n=1 Tax=Nonomuraea cypriaca TaxID=1187855 RepID=A0A931AL10_9ACTN|nr:nitroreductase/quinone reductase family protein [Nonomuraea cypriaca]MBF8193903.1 nitroreductase family deazaflavin-dependent oxidoreductase [Nonomuraea cypriaca]